MASSTRASGDDAPTVELLTGSTRKRDRTALLDRLVNGEIDILVGTHAVIQDGVVFDRLGLTIVDEQHRFGVRQRGELPSKGAVGPAHVLTMSATPIPRSLNLVLLGDIDVSVIDEMPPGREPVITRRYFGEERGRAYELLREEVKRGRQAFVICPLVEDSETRPRCARRSPSRNDCSATFIPNSRSVCCMAGCPAPKRTGS